MKNNLIKVKIEKAQDGTYWRTTQNIPGVVTADGRTISILYEKVDGVCYCTTIQ